MWGTVPRHDSSSSPAPTLAGAGAAGPFLLKSTEVVSGNTWFMVLPFGQGIQSGEVVKRYIKTVGLYRCERQETASSTARAAATPEAPGLVTVHCWSSVLSLVESPGATTSLQK